MKKINEQVKTQSSETVNLKDLRDVYGCSFLKDAYPTNINGNNWMLKKVETDSPNGTYKSGDTLIITNLQEDTDFYFVVIPSNEIKTNLGNQSINIELSNRFVGTWKCDNYTKMKRGVTQKLTAQQEKKIEELKAKGWKVSEGEHLADSAYWKPVNLKNDAELGKIFLQDFWMLYPAQAIEDKDLIGAFKALINTGTHNRENCRKMIENYDLMNTKQTPLDRGDHMTFQAAISTCRRLNINDDYNDLSITRKRLKRLEQLPDGNQFKINSLNPSTTTTTTTPQ